MHEMTSWAFDTAKTAATTRT